jgi:hypothetical protein
MRMSAKLALRTRRLEKWISLLVFPDFPSRSHSFFPHIFLLLLDLSTQLPFFLHLSDRHFFLSSLVLMSLSFV